MPSEFGVNDPGRLQGRIKQELKRIEYESHALRALLIFCALILGCGAISLLFSHRFWHQSSFVIRVPPLVLFVTMLVIMVLALYLVRYESEVRKLRLLTLQQALTAQADHVARTFDAVTNVFTRNFLSSLLKKEIARAERNNRPLTLMMCDIDNFKRVNDRYGHLMGDEILAQVAGVVKSCIRGCDHVVRYGGDEFLLILPETDAAGAAIVRDRILQRVAEWDLANRIGDIPVSLSLGFYHHVPGQTVEQDLAEVDSRMYAEKHVG